MSNVVSINSLKPSVKPISPPKTGLEKLVDNFLSGQGRKRKHGLFYISDNVLKHRTWINGERITDIAVKIQREGKTTVIGNSSILAFVGGKYAWGNYKRNRSQTEIQRLLETKAQMLPFSAFEEANLDLNQLNILDQSGAETIQRKRTEYDYDKNENVTRIESVHFTGASLFEVQGKYFLFDIDRREIKEGIFNPFIAEIPLPVKSIAEAYEALKPKAVISAEKKGLKTQRQGEWFFIPCKAPKFPNPKPIQSKIKKLQAEMESLSYVTEWEKREKLRKEIQKLQSRVPGQMEFRAGRNRPNHCTEAVKIKNVTYCKGTVSHSGREHADLKLEKWHVVVPNTAVKSFQITGDVD